MMWCAIFTSRKGVLPVCKYEMPDMQIIYFEAEDILTSSGTIDPSNPGGDTTVDPFG